MAKLHTLDQPFTGWVGVLRTRAFAYSLILSLLLWLLEPVLGFVLVERVVFTPLSIFSRFVLTVLIMTAGCSIGWSKLSTERRSEEIQQQKSMMEQVISSEPECVKTVARDGTLLDMNPAGLNIIEAKCLADVQYASVYDLIAPEDRAAYKHFNEQVFSGEQLSMEYDIIGLQGSRKTVDSHAVPLRDDQGNIVAHLAITRDVTALKRSQRELQKFSMAVEQCASMVMITDTVGKISYVNPRFCKVTGYVAHECIGETPKLLYSGKHSSEFYKDMWGHISHGKEWRGRVQNRRKNGDLYWASVVISPVKDNEGNILHFLCTQEDVTDSHILSQQLEYQARHCMLTGLINRHEFEDHLEQLLARAKVEKSQHAVLFIDLDQFKQINDACGHAAGDQLLRQMGQLFQQNMRQEDLISRIGGDEFAILIGACKADQIEQIAEHLRKAVEDFSFAWEHQTFKVTISVGCVVIDEFSPEMTTVLSQADASCYQAKDHGRNRVFIHRDAETDRLRQGEFQWVTKIHQGLESDRFVLYVQEIAALGGEEREHYEVLIRYIDDDGKVIPPGAFLPPAERYGISPKIDRWVVDEACRVLQEQLENRVSLSVNLSGLSVNDREFLNHVSDCIEKYKVIPERLCFEITETATIANLTEALTFIREMKALGCRFALDDFGSGLSSFGYLRSLPVDIVKIDGIFVKNIRSNEIDRAMVKSINEIGHLMGKKTVAEFVEDLASAELLTEMGVDYAQGYGIAKPKPIKELG